MVSRLSGLIALVVAAGLSLQPAAAEVRRLVLAAGANNGGVDRELLRYAVSDAEHFVAVLQEMGGLDPADVLLLRDPDLAAFEQGLADLGRRVQAARRRAGRLEVLLYYSGHADEEGLLLAAGDRLGYQQLLDSLKTTEAAVRIAILDACNSGAITRTKGGKRQPPFLVDESFDMRGYAFLTSSSADEAAQESDRIEASFFTHYLISGLRGAADVSGDGWVTLHEAYQFAFDETRARTIGTAGGIQNPAYEGQMRGTGDVVLTAVRRNAAGLLLDEGLAGRLFVRNAQQRLVAELNKSPGQKVELGLVPGAYTLFLAMGDADWQVAKLDLTKGKFAEVRGGTFRALSPEDARLRGGSRPRITLGRQIEVAAGEHYTLSLGLLTNTQDAAFRGVQFALLVNQARARTGTQVSWVGNLALKEIDGWQATLTGVNWGLGPLQGGQVGLLNIASQVRGSGLGPLQGGQVGLLNIAGKIRGWQVGVLNAASEVKGLQVGVINLSGHIEGGLPIGLINYSRSGLFNFSTWRDEVGFTLFTLASGSRSFYTSFTTGFADADGQRRWALGLGGGVQKRGQRFFLGLDAHIYRISRDLDDDYKAGVGLWPLKVDLGLDRLDRDNYLARIKLGTGVFLHRHLSLFGGISLNQLWTDSHLRLIESGSRYEKEWKDGLFAWPGFFFGLRYSR